MKHLIALICCACSLFGQAAKGTYTYEKETSLSGAAETVTIHLPAGNRTVRFVGATVYCSVACTVTLSRDGPAPTTTAGTATRLNITNSGATAVPYHTSNVGATAPLKNYNLAATEEKIIDLVDKGLIPGENLTLATSAITGTARIYFQWKEY